MFDPERLAIVHGLAFPDAPWDADTFATWLARPGSILAGDGDSFVLGHVAADEAEILTLATHPDHRREGLARLALTAFQQIATEKGARRSFLEVAEDNTAARALYHHADYQEIGRRRRYYQRSDGTRVDALILGRDLP